MIATGNNHYLPVTKHGASVHTLHWSSSPEANSSIQATDFKCDMTCGGTLVSLAEIEEPSVDADVPPSSWKTPRTISSPPAVPGHQRQVATVQQDRGRAVRSILPLLLSASSSSGTKDMRSM